LSENSLVLEVSYDERTFKPFQNTHDIYRV